MFAKAPGLKIVFTVSSIPTSGNLAIALFASNLSLASEASANSVSPLIKALPCSLASKPSPAFFLVKLFTRFFTANGFNLGLIKFSWVIVFNTSLPVLIFVAGSLNSSSNLPKFSLSYLFISLANSVKFMSVNPSFVAL